MSTGKRGAIVRRNKSHVTNKQIKDPDEAGDGSRVQVDEKMENSFSEGKSKRRKWNDTSREAKELKQNRPEDQELKDTLYYLRREVQTLTGKVKQLTDENRELHAKVIALETKARIHGDDEENCMDWEDERLREEWGSATPVHQSTREENETVREDHQSRDNRGQKLNNEELYHMEYENMSGIRNRGGEEWSERQDDNDSGKNISNEEGRREEKGKARERVSIAECKMHK